MKVVILSAFIPYESVFSIRRISREEAIKIINKADKVDIYTQHETIKILGLSPAKERAMYIPERGDVQIWIKPHKRLEPGREYTLEEIEEIGYDIWIAEPLEGGAQ
jgi:hypothetical protein